MKILGSWFLFPISCVHSSSLNTRSQSSCPAPSCPGELRPQTAGAPCLHAPGRSYAPCVGCAVVSPAVPCQYVFLPPTQSCIGAVKRCACSMANSSSSSCLGRSAGIFHDQLVPVFHQSPVPNQLFCSELPQQGLPTCPQHPSGVIVVPPATATCTSVCASQFQNSERSSGSAYPFPQRFIPTDPSVSWARESVPPHQPNTSHKASPVAIASLPGHLADLPPPPPPPPPLPSRQTRGPKNLHRDPSSQHGSGESTDTKPAPGVAESSCIANDHDMTPGSVSEKKEIIVVKADCTESCTKESSEQLIFPAGDTDSSDGRAVLNTEIPCDADSLWYTGSHCPPCSFVLSASSGNSDVESDSVDLSLPLGVIKPDPQDDDRASSQQNSGSLPKRVRFNATEGGDGVDSAVVQSKAKLSGDVISLEDNPNASTSSKTDELAVKVMRAPGSGKSGSVDKSRAKQKRRKVWESLPLWRAVSCSLSYYYKEGTIANKVRLGCYAH